MPPLLCWRVERRLADAAADARRDRPSDGPPTLAVLLPSPPLMLAARLLPPPLLLHLLRSRRGTAGSPLVRRLPPAADTAPPLACRLATAWAASSPAPSCCKLCTLEVDGYLTLITALAWRDSSCWASVGAPLLTRRLLLPLAAWLTAAVDTLRDPMPCCLPAAAAAASAAWYLLAAPLPVLPPEEARSSGAAAPTVPAAGAAGTAPEPLERRLTVAEEAVVEPCRGGGNRWRELQQ
jgi:hypothetical protein